MALPDPIDLLHRGLTRNVGCYLVETDDGIALFDCGPTPCIPNLEAGLAGRAPLPAGEPRSCPAMESRS